MCKEKRRVYLTGIGTGGYHTLTIEAENIIKGCSCIIGAERMVRALEQFQKPVYISYRPEEIRGFLDAHPEYPCAVVALSGDTGFYSGAKGLEEALKDYETVRIPGISSVACLAARLGIPWEDAGFVSAHGRGQNYIHGIAHREKTFLLLGGKGSGDSFCQKIKEYGLTDVEIIVGQRLSYEDEAVLNRTGSTIRPEDFSGLDAVFIRNPSPDRYAMGHLEDEELIRGKVPMTKAEVRAVSIAKLHLTRDAVLYDIGAGTGSASIEAALLSGEIRVYAVEKNPEGVALIHKNRKKFKCDGIEVIEGEAPEALKSLPPPSHVFIGGSSGNLCEIIGAAREKNAKARIVINAISLETVSEAVKAAKEGLLADPEFVQIAAARSRKLGSYHMMTAMNPIYVISDGKE